MYPARMAEIVYPDEGLIRRVSPKGDLKFGGERTSLSQVLAYETVSLTLSSKLYRIGPEAQATSVYVSNSRTTLPWTSVSRKLRPWNL